MRAGTLLLAALAGATACVIGGEPGSYPPAQSPAGVRVRIELTRGNLAGELLSADSAGLLVLTDTKRLLRVPFDVARLVEPRFGSPVEVPRTGERALERLGAVKRMSRFPQGVSGELLEKLRAQYGQDSVVVVRR